MHSTMAKVRSPSTNGWIIPSSRTCSPALSRRVRSGAAAPDVDPGRARNPAFFDKVYGDCRTGGVENLSQAWHGCRRRRAKSCRLARSMARRARSMPSEPRLDALPANFDVYLLSFAGAYNCRVIAGTSRVSAHGQGIAIDIAPARADYWRNAARQGRRLAFKNAIPMEIVRIFEKHGFIWGGRWYPTTRCISIPARAVGEATLADDRRPVSLMPSPRRLPGQLL